MLRAALVLLLLLLSTGPAHAQKTALTGATVYDGTGGAPLTDAVVVIDAGRIACVGADCAVPEGAEAVDLAGRFVTPGLVDGHVHYAQTGWIDGRPDSGVGTDHYDYEGLQASLRENPDRWHRAYLCSGVTAVFDPGGLPWTLDLEADAENHTERPHIQAAGPLITHAEHVMGVVSALGTHTFLSMQTDEEAVEHVRELAALGARAVKVWYLDPPPEQADALDARLLLIGEEARKRGLPLIVHATELRNAKLALRAGAAMLVHSVMDGPVDDEFLRLAREAGTVYAPTLLVMGNWARAGASVGLGVVYPLDDPNGCVDAETRRVIAEAPTLTASAPERLRDPARQFDQLERSGRLLAVMEANLARVHEAGIPVVTSTDAGNPLTVHGPSIYPEMEAMEAAGIPPEDVLVMSTRNGAAMMGRLDDFGTVEAGKLADLIVLTEDPGASTRAFRSITHVMRGGVLREVGHFAAQ
ncbi:MAG: amidohydrolase family protein [Rhodothermales bacterium]|nr:amidohydrolase family protein [Rhodothermales bacterium]